MPGSVHSLIPNPPAQRVGLKFQDLIQEIQELGWGRLRVQAADDKECVTEGQDAAAAVGERKGESIGPGAKINIVDLGIRSKMLYYQ